MINQKVLLKNETTYRFGGMCKNFFLLDDKKDLDNFDEYDIFDEYFILGKGSNVAFSENEFDGAVIQSKINYINFDNKTNKLELGSGTYLYLGQGDDNHKAHLHTTNYDFNDNLLPVGVNFWVELVKKYFSK